MAPRSSRLSSCSLPRFRSQPIQLPFALVPDAAAMEEQETFAVRRRLVALVQAGDARRAPLRAARRRSRRAPQWRRSSRRAAQDERRPPRPTGDGSRAVRSAPRFRRASSSSVGTATSVRRLDGTPSRSARPGSARGANWSVTMRFTNTTAASDAGISASSASSSRPRSRCLRSRGAQQRGREQEPGRYGDRSEVAEDPGGGGRANEPAAHGGPESQLALERGTPVRDQEVAGLLLRGASSHHPARCAAEASRRVASIARWVTSSSVRPEPRARSSIAWR